MTASATNDGCIAGPAVTPEGVYLAPEARRLLLEVAGASIDHGLRHGRPLPVMGGDYPPPLREPRATFVTLHREGQLRGCIGSLQAHRPLVADIAHNAYAAAFSDPRFRPLGVEERPQLEVHLSILSPPLPMAFTSEADLLAQLRPGVDGLILEDGGRRGTFLPAVWESLPEPWDFLTHLKLKAGLSAGYWSPGLRLWRYTTESFS